MAYCFDDVIDLTNIPNGIGLDKVDISSIFCLPETIHEIITPVKYCIDDANVKEGYIVVLSKNTKLKRPNKRTYDCRMVHLCKGKYSPNSKPIFEVSIFLIEELYPNHVHIHTSICTECYEREIVGIPYTNVCKCSEVVWEDMGFMTGDLYSSCRYPVINRLIPRIFRSSLRVYQQVCERL